MFGLIVYKNGDKKLIKRAIEKGFYTVKADNEKYRTISPKNFIPTDFGLQ